MLVDISSLYILFQTSQVLKKSKHYLKVFSISKHNKQTEVLPRVLKSKFSSKIIPVHIKHVQKDKWNLWQEICSEWTGNTCICLSRRTRQNGRRAKNKLNKLHKKRPINNQLPQPQDLHTQQKSTNKEEKNKKFPNHKRTSDPSQARSKLQAYNNEIS